MLSPAQFPLQVVKLVTKSFEGDDWVFEIKHDGFRIIAIRDGASTRLYTSNGGVQFLEITEGGYLRHASLRLFS
jgi:ATP-dependent DNA ligase